MKQLLLILEVSNIIFSMFYNVDLRDTKRQINHAQVIIQMQIHQQQKQQGKVKDLKEQEKASGIKSEVSIRKDQQQQLRQMQKQIQEQNQEAPSSSSSQNKACSISILKPNINIFLKIFSSLRKEDCLKIVITGFTSQILKYIEPQNFISLHQLRLLKCKITNIESLSYLNVPLLYYVRIQQNLFKSIQPLGKCCWKNLYYLYLQENYILQSQTLSRQLINNRVFTFKFDKQKMSFGRNIEDISDTIVKDYNFIIKLQCDDFSDFVMLDLNRRLRENPSLQKLLNSIKKKFITFQQY